MKVRTRKSKFVRLFDKTPPTVFCPHFYELILSNGCPYDCAYCYLKGTMFGQMEYVTFNNPWVQILGELEKIKTGVFVTGELSDSLALKPNHFDRVVDYFRRQSDKYLLLVTKSTAEPLKSVDPSDQIIVSFSVNNYEVAELYEKGAPPPADRIMAAMNLMKRGWRVRFRLDPIVIGYNYEPLCRIIQGIGVERVTVGSLRHYPRLYRFTPTRFPGLSRGDDGRLRYTMRQRISIYRVIAKWLGSQPALCKETKILWNELGWKFEGCNCTK